jgi:hypothetical protein
MLHLLIIKDIFATFAYLINSRKLFGDCRSDYLTFRNEDYCFTTFDRGCSDQSSVFICEKSQLYFVKNCSIFVKFFEKCWKNNFLTFFTLTLKSKFFLNFLFQLLSIINSFKSRQGLAVLLQVQVSIGQPNKCFFVLGVHLDRLQAKIDCGWIVTEL